MAKQIGIIKLGGSIEDLNFYQTRESGLLVRKKSSLTKERVEKDPAFAGSRKSSSEFGRAAKGAGLLRRTMKQAGYQFSEPRIVSRLTGVLRRVITTDNLHEKGERQLDSADLSQLVGFEWNKYQCLANLYFRKPVFSIDPVRGLLEVDLPGINSSKDLNVPKKATHVQFVMEGVAVDIRKESATGVEDSTEWLSLKRKHPGQALHGIVAEDSGTKLMVGLGIRFGHELNGRIEPVLNRTMMAFMIGAVGER